MKVQLKRAFKSSSLLLADRLCMIFFPIPVQMCSRCLNSQFLNQCSHILLSPLFRKMFQAPGQKKQNGKRNCQLPPNSFSSNLRDIPPDISIDPLWLYISLYISWCVDHEKLHQTFLLASLQAKLSTKFLPLRQKEITHFPHQAFLENLYPLAE